MLPAVIVAAAFPAGLGGTIGLGGEWEDTISIVAARQAVAGLIGGAWPDTLSVAAARHAVAALVGGAWPDTLAIEAGRSTDVQGPLSFSDLLRIEATRDVSTDTSRLSFGDTLSIAAARAVASNLSMRPFTDALQVAAARSADVEGVTTEDCFTLNPPGVFNTSGARWYWSNSEQIVQITLFRLST